MLDPSDLLPQLQQDPRCGPLSVLCVDGRSGSGKSEWARRAQDAFSRRLECPPGDIALVCLEDLYAGWEGLAAAPGWAELLVLRPLAHHRTARWPVWDWRQGKFGPWRELQMPVTRLLILEGVGAAAPLLRTWATRVVWLDLPEPVRRQRVRDRERRAGADTTHEWWDAWALAEDRYLDSNPLAPEGVVFP